MSTHPRLEAFLRSYLAVEDEHDISSAVRHFVQGETPTAAEELRMEIRNWLSVGAPIEEVGESFARFGLFLAGETAEEIRRTLIDVFDRLQGQLLPGLIREKPYDVFISYSSVDRVAANRLALALKSKGYVVWIDTWEILIGHNIVDEVFRGITESGFLVVLLSPASSKSFWVQEELTAAKVAEIEQRKVTVLPVMIEPCEIPPSLRTKRFANLTDSWDEGLLDLTSSIDFHRSAAKVKGKPDDQSSVSAFAQLTRIREELTPLTYEMGFEQNSAFKDVLIGPPDHDRLR